MAGAAGADLLVGRVRRDSRPRSRRRSCTRPGSARRCARRPRSSRCRTTALSSPSGNGGASGVPSTSWRPGTGIGSPRPGSASSGVTMVVGFEKRNMPISLPIGRNVTRSSDDGRADEERLGRACRRLHADALRALDPPVADAVEAEHVTLTRRSGQLALIDRPATVREDELECVADRVPARCGPGRLREEFGVALERRQRGGAALTLVLALDAGQRLAPFAERPLEGVEIGGCVIRSRLLSSLSDPDAPPPSE